MGDLLKKYHRRRDAHCKADMITSVLIFISFFFLASQVLPLVLNVPVEHTYLGLR